MMTQRTEALYRAHRPPARPGGFPPSLADLIHAVEVTANVGVSKEELASQLRINEELFEAILDDVGVGLAERVAGRIVDRPAFRVTSTSE